MIVLGIDAAWTEGGASGFALVAADSERTVCLAMAASCDEFTDGCSGFDVPAILRMAEQRAGRPVDVVAVDMPLAIGPIVTRRAADDAVSRTFGAAGASVHSPSLMQTGLGERVRGAFEQAGYRLAVVGGGMRIPALIETYPHPIAMQLCGSRRRVPYKVAKTLTYWPGSGMRERRSRLRKVWHCIHRELSARVTVRLPELDDVFTRSLGSMKRYEDGLDALLCTLAGIAFGRGQAVGYGDSFAAIWLPSGAEDFRGRGTPFEQDDSAWAEMAG